MKKVKIFFIFLCFVSVFLCSVLFAENTDTIRTNQTQLRFKNEEQRKRVMSRKNRIPVNSKIEADRIRMLQNKNKVIVNPDNAIYTKEIKHIDSQKAFQEKRERTNQIRLQLQNKKKDSDIIRQQKERAELRKNNPKSHQKAEDINRDDIDLFKKSNKFYLKKEYSEATNILIILKDKYPNTKFNNRVLRLFDRIKAESQTNK